MKLTQMESPHIVLTMTRFSLYKNWQKSQHIEQFVWSKHSSSGGWSSLTFWKMNLCKQFARHRATTSDTTTELELASIKRPVTVCKIVITIIVENTIWFVVECILFFFGFFFRSEKMFEFLVHLWSVVDSLKHSFLNFTFEWRMNECCDVNLWMSFDQLSDRPTTKATINLRSRTCRSLWSVCACVCVVSR